MAKEKKVTLANYSDQFIMVFPTDTNPYHEHGVAVMMHPDSAKRLIEKGYMTEEMPEGYVESGHMTNKDDE